MVQIIQGDRAIKTHAEFNYQGLRGTPYCVIHCSYTLKKNRLYLLDTKEKLYYSIAEWDEKDRDADDKWYKYLLGIDDKIREQRKCLEKEGLSLSDFDKIEQVVLDEDKMTKDLSSDSWSI
jgi:hypothetical protein